MKVVSVPLDKIRIGRRHRKDEGDLESLAQSIRDVGLLQPIGVDEYYNLIFGARRMIACGDILRWTEIPCHILKIDSILAGEYAENEFRKAFTVSEREALSRALEAESLKKHQGARTDRGGSYSGFSLEDNQKIGNNSKLLQQNIAEVPPSQRQTRVDIAKAAGFGNPETMQQARRVVEKGAPETIAAMDAGDLSIAAAAAVSSQPKEDQARIVSMPKDERKTVIRDIRRQKAEREANERRARDLRLFRGLAEAVEFIAGFYEDPKETWDGLSRVSAFKFSEHLDRALECLTRIRRAHPNEKRKPGIVGSSA